jgi:hypothetical protein
MHVESWPTDSLIKYCSLDNVVGIATVYGLDVRSQDSVVGIATRKGLEDRGVGVQVPVVSRIFSSPHRPDRLWGPPNLLSNGYRGSFPGGKAAGA